MNPTASARQVQAASWNIKKAQQGARRKRTNARLPKGTRSELGKQAGPGSSPRWPGRSCARGSQPPAAYEIAKDKNIPGRSKMGKWDLIKAIRKIR